MRLKQLLVASLLLLACASGASLAQQTGPGSRIPGPRGPIGPTGAQGAAGVNAFTSTGASFTMPAPSSSVAVTVGSTAWMSVGQALYVAGAGYFTVSSITSPSVVVLTNAGAGLNATPGTTIAAASTVSPAGNVVSMSGTSVINPGTGTLEAVLPMQTVTGASRAYATADFFKKTRRSNSGSAMSDTLPASTATGLVNGTRINIANVDASASLALAAGSGTTLCTSCGVITAGRDLMLVYDQPNTAWRADANTAIALLGPNNLSDVPSPSTARANLGITATGADTTYAWRANNLSDLASASTARTNLGLGTAATANTGTSGATVPLLNGANTWSGNQTFGTSTTVTTPDGTAATSSGFAGGSAPIKFSYGGGFAAAAFTGSNAGAVALGTLSGNVGVINAYTSSALSTASTLELQSTGNATIIGGNLQPASNAGSGLGTTSLAFSTSYIEAIVSDTALNFGANNTGYWRITGTGNFVNTGSNTQVFGWSNAGSATLDTGFSRISAGIIGVGTGGAQSIAGGMQMASLALDGATIGSYSFNTSGTANFGSTVSIGGTNSSNVELRIAGQGGSSSTWELYSTDDNGNVVLAARDDGYVYFGGGANGTQLAIGPGPASSVDYFSILGAATGNRPQLAVLGSDTNIGMSVSTKGSGVIYFYNNNFGNHTLAIEEGTTNDQNYFFIQSAANGSGPTIVAATADAESTVPINLSPRGTAPVISNSNIWAVSSLTTWTDTQNCTPGWFTMDASYIYVCAATNTVKRVALSAF